MPTPERDQGGGRTPAVQRSRHRHGDKSPLETCLEAAAGGQGSNMQPPGWPLPRRSVHTPPAGPRAQSSTPTPPHGLSPSADREGRERGTPWRLMDASVSFPFFLLPVLCSAPLSPLARLQQSTASLQGPVLHIPGGAVIMKEQRKKQERGSKPSSSAEPH